MRRDRQKQCALCKVAAPVLFRCRYEEPGDWQFVCRDCWQIVSQDNPFYQYGGTWKSKKR